MPIVNITMLSNTIAFDTKEIFYHLRQSTDYYLLQLLFTNTSEAGIRITVWPCYIVLD
jgi:hypothetical protein